MIEGFDAFKKNIKKVVVGAGIVAASIMPKGEANAAGLFGNKDKNSNKTEQATDKKESNHEKTTNLSDTIIGGVKYPFAEEYRTDKDSYRMVTYGESMDQMMSIKKAMSNARAEILAQIGSNEASISGLKVLNQKTFLKDGKYITIIAVEVLKDNVIVSSKS